jgi:hypothetical protein
MMRKTIVVLSGKVSDVLAMWDHLVANGLPPDGDIEVRLRCLPPEAQSASFSIAPTTIPRNAVPKEIQLSAQISLQLDQALPVTYDPMDAEGRPVVTAAPVFTWDTAPDGVLLKMSMDPSNPKKFYLYSGDGTTTGHFTGTVTGTANASTASGEAERDVVATVLLDIMLVPDEAASANFDLGAPISVSNVPVATVEVAQPPVVPPSQPPPFVPPSA